VSDKEVARDRIIVGKISAKEKIQKEINVYFLGEEGEIKDVAVSLEYRAESQNAILAKNAGYSVRISQSPVGVSLNFPKEIESGQEISVEVEYVSNSSVRMPDLYLKMEYSPGFRYISSSVQPVEGNNMWKIGDLSVGDRRSFVIRGLVEGQDNVELGFRALVGAGKSIEKKYGSGSATIVIKKPFLNFAFKSQNEDLSIVKTGQYVPVSIPWKNNLNVELRDVVITVRIAGDAVDKKTISVSNGFYRSVDNAIVWNPTSQPKLKTIAPGDSGSVSFDFNIVKNLKISSSKDKNFIIVITGEIEGLKAVIGGQAEPARSVLSREVKITTDLQFVEKGYFYQGAFTNTGPLPPRVGEETTYTINWSLSNSYNDVSDVVVRSFLPSYMRYVNTVSPQGESITYNHITGEVVWQVGKIEAGTGIIRPAKEVSFMVGLTPGPNQLKITPNIIGDVSYEGKDDFTGIVSRGLVRPISTMLDDEPGFTREKSAVV
jgi:hypothetical protein